MLSQQALLAMIGNNRETMICRIHYWAGRVGWQRVAQHLAQEGEMT